MLTCEHQSWSTFCRLQLEHTVRGAHPMARAKKRYLLYSLKDLADALEPYQVATVGSKRSKRGVRRGLLALEMADLGLYQAIRLHCFQGFAGMTRVARSAC